jgi:acetate kinase
MTAPRTGRILTMNSGSSSLKYSLYQMGEAQTRALAGEIERIGLRGGVFRMRDAAGQTLLEEHPELPDHDAALRILFDCLGKRFPDEKLDAVGHRVVHGGVKYCQPCLITPEVLIGLDEIVRLAPEHLPHELKAIRAVQQHYPGLPQVACFDTAFHRHMPELAQRYPLVRSLWHEGVRRYGFHGLSYEYIVENLRQVAGAEAAEGRVIVAHLGNGASMAAVRGGIGVDTTMGFTPAGGLMMGTRSGDLDPGVLVYLLVEKGRTPATLDYLVNQRSGLIGVSGSSSDVRDLLGRQSEDPCAAQAIELYCYLARKHLGALAAVLGGLDTLVFTAGVGTYAPTIRERICQGMEFLGIRLDAQRNAANAAVISAPDSPATVRVMKTDEELIIARHTWKMLQVPSPD